MSAHIDLLLVYARRDGRDIRVAQCVGRVTYSIAPAAQQVVGHGVLWLELNGFIQMILGGEANRQTGRRFSLLIHDTAAISTAFCSDLICPASPTHKYFTNTSHTRDLAERPHTPGCHTPSLVLFHSPSLIEGFFHILPFQHALSLSLFHLSKVLQVYSVC